MDKMKFIYINGRFLDQQVTGVQRFAIEFLKSLDEQVEKKDIILKDNKIILLTPKKTKVPLIFKHIDIKKIGLFSGHIWEQIFLPIFTRGQLLINLCNTGPAIKFKQICTIHDTSIISVPQSYSMLFRMWYKFLLICLNLFARKIITVSSFSKKELISNVITARNKKIEVVYLGHDHINKIKADYNILKKYNLNGKKYILAVSSLAYHKNFDSIIKLGKYFNGSRYEIVIAGGAAKKAFAKLNIEPSKNIKLLGYINDNELKALYENATCFIFPSIYEGFGLPPIEAMACGCPTLVSNIDVLKEICGDAAEYIDPLNIGYIYEKCLNVLENDVLRDEMINRGHYHISNYTWKNCTLKIFNIIEEIL